ncbi:fibronectin type III domain-containing protein [Gorillibacterium sp. CAU 1737]|uniref:fibronectin type III domain-containing protein n=1 Tax=Gorillibacterium sp. CAU 1737 TaxID=3140362 RepID=UPI003260287D
MEKIRLALVFILVISLVFPVNTGFSEGQYYVYDKYGYDTTLITEYCVEYTTDIFYNSNGEQTGSSTYCIKYEPYAEPFYVYRKTSFIESVVALDGSYSSSGYTNGFWYERRGIYKLPQMEIITPVNQMVITEQSIIPILKVSGTSGSTLSVKYYIDSETTPRGTRLITNAETPQVVTFDSLDIRGLSEGVHTLMFSAGDELKTIEELTSIVIDRSNPTIDSINSSATESQITLTGSAHDALSGLHSSPYNFTIGSVSSGWTSENTFSRTGLTPNTDYTVKIEAKDAVGHVASQTQSVYTRAEKPSLSISATTENSFRLSLSDHNPAGTQYLIQAGAQYVNSSGIITSTPEWMSPANKSITVSGLTAGTSYPLQVKARNTQGVETASSSFIATTLPLPPSNVIDQLSQQWIKLSWPAVAGATGYDVEADGIVKNNGLNTSYTHSGLTANTQHTYRVRVRNAGGIGAWSAWLTKQTLPDPPPVPGNLKVNGRSQTSLSLSWDLVPRATKYEVEANGSIIYNGNHNSFESTGLEAKTNYRLRVRASNTGGASEWSPVLQQATLPNPPQMPKGISPSLSIHSVELNWPVVEEATGYEVEADGLIIENESKTSFVHKDLEAVSNHTYRIRAKNEGGKSPWSEPLRVVTHPEKPMMPTNIMMSSDASTITTSWYVVPYAASYDVEMDGTSVVNVEGSSFVHEKLTSSEKHSYRIRAKNISGDSEWSKPVVMSTLPPEAMSTSLTNIVAVVTNKSILLSWDAVDVDARYDIEVDGKLLDNGQDTLYQHSGLNPEEYHTYKIRAKNANGPGDWVAVLALSTLPNLPDAPDGIQANADQKSIELHWGKVEGATEYELEIDGQPVDIGNRTTYLHEGLSSGTSHTYRVRAKNATGVTAWSPALQKSTKSPDYVIRTRKNEVFDLSLFASHVQDFSEMTFVVTYDPNQMELVDLYDFTPKTDLQESGLIPGSNLTVTYTPGKITFKVDQNIVPGTSWTGELTTVLFRGKVNGDVTLHVTVE